MALKFTSKYKILYITYHPNIGGGETTLLSLLSRLDKKIFKPIVIVTKKGQLTKKLKNEKVETHVVPLNGYLTRILFIPGISPIGIYNLFKIVQRIKPDLIHLNHLNLAVYAGIVGKKLKIPVVATAHGSWDSIYFYQDWINRLFTDKIFASTPQIKKRLIKRGIVPPSQVNIIPFGIDLNIFKPGNKIAAKKKFGFLKNDKVITIVGRLDPVKNHLTFLRAADVIGQKIKNARFFIVGSKLGNFSSSSNYQLTINNYLKKHLLLAKKITFGGFIENMPSVYQASSILVSTSAAESFGLTVIEAAACQVPVVSTESNIIIRNGETGYTVPAKNYLQIADKVIKLCKNPILAKNFGRIARKRVSEHLPIEFYSNKTEKIYKQLMTKKN